MTRLEKAEKELDEFLKDHPEMAKMQNELTLALGSIGDNANERMRYIAKLMETSVTNLLIAKRQAKKMLDEAEEKIAKRTYH